ncbi:unnamed protein product [Caenorhabditis bovis]|uniref:Peptidase S1 domain-containing protein n=1 Tax=Caenorhabditis bovis TaxID=2654633 RepID=A0A8S1E7Y9_9PELO|nr:unnamed protein product [Caenorhabditis bovis]
MMPWAVQLQLKHDDGVGSVTCGGTLITKKHVITAAHCFQKKFLITTKSRNPSRFCEKDSRYSNEEILRNLYARVGATCTKLNKDLGCTNRKQLGKFVNVKRFLMGPLFENNCENGGDYFIAELAESIDNFDGANHACLPFFSNVTIPKKGSLDAFGWGSDPSRAYDNISYPMLQRITLDIMPFEECNENWYESLPPDAICTVEEPEKNVCKGDSGGGLLYALNNRFYLAAIVSYGTDCGKMLLGAEPKGQINTDIRKYFKEILNFISF